MGTVAFILKGYPRLSETFIAQEIRALERGGLTASIISLRHPTDTQTHPVHREIAAPVTYLPEYLHRETLRVLRVVFNLSRRKKFWRAAAVWWRDLMRDPTPNRVRRFGQAVVLADELPIDVDHLHAHFIHTPASVARYASLLTGLPWSISAHAKDIWTTPDWEKREKLVDCKWAVTCTAAGFQHLETLAPQGRLHLVYHGLDFERFPPPQMAPSRRDGSDAKDPTVLLSVGRAVEKKGYDVLISALSRIPMNISWKLIHIGGGPHLDRLRRLAEQVGVSDRIQWLGPQPQNVVLENYRLADLFVLPSIVAQDGDRDGLPNVLMEAQSQGLACISARLPAIAELVTDGTNGVLVDPGDAVTLAAMIADLAKDPRRRQTLGEAALRHVHERFSLSQHIGRLAALFDRDSGHETDTPCGLHSTPL